MGPRSLPHTVRHHSGGGLVTGFFGAFVLMILYALSQFLAERAGLSVSLARGLCAALALASLLWMYFFFSTDYVATVDAERITLTSQSRVGPIRGRLDTIVDVRWSDVSVVRDTTRSRLTKHGNVQKSYRLTMGKHHIDSAVLGTMNRDGLYLELIEAVGLAVGDKLVAHEDLGELGAVVRKIVAQDQDARRE